jgi:hypothetical protein
MSPLLRKLSLTAHIAFSVGWIGAVAAFLALSIVGATSSDAQTIRGAYLAMNLMSLLVIVPMSLVSLTTGLIEALGTPWGLFRHYWVVAKLVITVAASGLLILHQFTAVAAAASRVLGAVAVGLPSAGRTGIQLVLDSSLAIIALLTAATLAVYKPPGLTSANWRNGLSPGLRTFLAVIGAIVVVAVVVHVSGLSEHGHAGI